MIARSAVPHQHLRPQGPDDTGASIDDLVRLFSRSGVFADDLEGTAAHNHADGAVLCDTGRIDERCVSDQDIG